MLTEFASKCRHASAVLLAAVMAGCAAVTPVPDASNRLAEARQVLQEARTTATALEDAELRDLALAVIAGWQANAKDVPDALKTAAAIADASAKAHALGEIAAVQVQAGDQAGATKTLEQALQTAAAIADAFCKADALGEIAAAQARAGDQAGAAKTCEQALQAAATTPLKSDGGLSKAIVVAVIAADCVDAGDRQGTLAWAATRGDDAVAKVSALVGAAAAILQPGGHPGSGTYEKQLRLLPPSMRQIF